MSNNKQHTSGRGSNLSTEDRSRGGRHSHSGGSKEGSHAGSGRGSNLSQDARRKGGEHSHKERS